jgi:hypothetical protein
MSAYNDGACNYLFLNQKIHRLRKITLPEEFGVDGMEGLKVDQASKIKLSNIGYERTLIQMLCWC